MEEEQFAWSDLKPDIERPKEPLEAFMLEQLAMVVSESRIWRFLLSRTGTWMWLR